MPAVSCRDGTGVRPGSIFEIIFLPGHEDGLQVAVRRQRRAASDPSFASDRFDFPAFLFVLRHMPCRCSGFSSMLHASCIAAIRPAYFLHQSAPKRNARHFRQSGNGPDPPNPQTSYSRSAPGRRQNDGKLRRLGPGTIRPPPSQPRRHDALRGDSSFSPERSSYQGMASDLYPQSSDGKFSSSQGRIAEFRFVPIHRRSVMRTVFAADIRPLRQLCRETAGTGYRQAISSRKDGQGRPYDFTPVGNRSGRGDFHFRKLVRRVFSERLPCQSTVFHNP